MTSTHIDNDLSQIPNLKNSLYQKSGLNYINFNQGSSLKQVYF